MQETKAKPKNIYCDVFNYLRNPYAVHIISCLTACLSFYKPAKPQDSLFSIKHADIVLFTVLMVQLFSV